MHTVYVMPHHDYHRGKERGRGTAYASPSHLLIPQGHAAGLLRPALHHAQGDTPVLHFSQERMLTITETRLRIVLARGTGGERQPSEVCERLQGYVPMATPAHSPLMAQWMCVAGA